MQKNETTPQATATTGTTTATPTTTTSAPGGEPKQFDLSGIRFEIGGKNPTRRDKRKKAAFEKFRAHCQREGSKNNAPWRVRLDNIRTVESAKTSVIDSQKKIGEEFSTALKKGTSKKSLKGLVSEGEGTLPGYIDLVNSLPNEKASAGPGKDKDVVLACANAQMDLADKDTISDDEKRFLIQCINVWIDVLLHMKSSFAKLSQEALKDTNKIEKCVVEGEVSEGLKNGEELSNMYDAICVYVVFLRFLRNCGLMSTSDSFFQGFCKICVIIHTYDSELKALSEEKDEPAFRAAVRKNILELTKDDSFFEDFIKENKQKWRTEELDLDQKFSVEQVTQGGTGDCYFLSAIVSIVKHNPDVIKKCFVKQDEKTVTIRFFRKDSNGKTRAEYITVPKTSWGYLSLGASWVRMLEKAFAVYRSKEETYNDDISTGSASEGMFALTGKTSKYIKISDVDRKDSTKDPNGKKFSGEYFEERITLFNTIKEKLKNGVPIAATIFKNRKVRKGLESGHEYSVIGTEEQGKTKYIIVRNPQGIFGTIREYGSAKADGRRRSNEKELLDESEMHKEVCKLADLYPNTLKKTIIEKFGVDKYLSWATWYNIFIARKDVTDKNVPKDVYAAAGISKIELNDFFRCFSSVTYLNSSVKDEL